MYLLHIMHCFKSLHTLILKFLQPCEVDNIINHMLTDKNKTKLKHREFSKYTKIYFVKFCYE